MTDSTPRFRGSAGGSDPADRTPETETEVAASTQGASESADTADSSADSADSASSTNSTDSMDISTTKADTSKVTAEQLRQRVAARKARQRSEAVESAIKRAPVLSYGRLAVTAVACAVAVGCFVYGQATSAAHEDKLAAGASEISDLRSQINDADGQVNSMPTADQLSAAMGAAADRGRELADAQNRMKDTAPVQGDSESMAEYGRQTDEMKRFFTSSALSNGEFLPHGQWYAPHEPGLNEEGRPAWVPLPPQSWTWEMIPSMEVEPDGTVPVIFEARIVEGENAGELMAWIIARYDPGVNLFHNLRLGHTPDGHARLGATTSPEAFGASSEILREVPTQEELFDQAELEAARERADAERAEQDVADNAEQDGE